MNEDLLFDERGTTRWMPILSFAERRASIEARDAAFAEISERLDNFDYDDFDARR